MAGDLEFKDAQALYEGARDARINLCVFEGNANIPGEVSSLARMLWFHIPELAKRSGVQIDESREGHPAGVFSPDNKLVEVIARDMDGGRDMVSWLGAVATPQTKAMFAPGGGNAMDAVLDRFAKDRGFERDDLLAREAAAARGSDSGRATQSREADQLKPSSILQSIVPEGKPKMSPFIAGQLAMQMGR
jgi:hypothetical protein